jgi:hypothetical protein
MRVGESTRKRGREAYAAVIRPDAERIDFVKMPPGTITTKDISVRISRRAKIQYVPHAAEVEDYEFCAYVDTTTKKKNAIGNAVADLLGFNGPIHGTVVIVGPPDAQGCGQPFDEKTKILLQKRTEKLFHK